MKPSEEYEPPEAVAIAHDILYMHRTILALENKVAHQEDLLKIHQDSWKSTEKHQGEMLGVILGAVMDPESSINSNNRPEGAE